ncbi:MAG: heparan-alpha-glucosaminide N-acetyltransferase domain-containing protein [Balneolales bacterium]
MSQVQTQSAPTGKSLTNERLVSLDAFRGITIMGMILVNNPGSWGSLYAPLAHATWHGWTPTDLVFPFFLFIVGVAIAFAFTKQLAKGADPTDLVRKLAQRSLIIFGLGLVMAGYPYFTVEGGFGLHGNLTDIRIPGVLQRIALCYFFASLLFLYTSHRTQVYTIIGLLFGYWFMMTTIPVPGFGAGLIDDPEANLAAYIDRLILGTHIYLGGPYDPEGILSTLPAIATTLFGIITGRILVSDKEKTLKTVQLFVMGALLIVAGYIWNWYFPINKALWTSSYVVFTAGQAMCGLALCYWFIDVQKKQTWSQPFVEYGINAITVYFLSGILAETLGLIHFNDNSLQAIIYQNIFVPLSTTPEISSLLYALTWVGLWYGILHMMYKRKIIIKV